MGSTLIGAGEVGRVFLRAGRDVTVLRRGDALVPSPDGTILIAVREDDLAPLVGALRPYASRCAFVQNGLVDDVLAPLGVVTRGLVWFTAKGSTFHVLAPSVFHGPRAEDCAAWLTASGVAARVEPDAQRFRHDIARKLAWNNVAGLAPYVRNLTLGAYLDAHAEETHALIDETLGDDQSGAAFLAEMSVTWPDVGRVLMTGAASLERAQAVPCAAFVRKPFLLDDVVRALVVARSAG